MVAIARLLARRLWLCARIGLALNQSRLNARLALLVALAGAKAADRVVRQIVGRWSRCRRGLVLKLPLLGSFDIVVVLAELRQRRLRVAACSHIRL